MGDPMHLMKACSSLRIGVGNEAIVGGCSDLIVVHQRYSDFLRTNPLDAGS